MSAYASDDEVALLPRHENVLLKKTPVEITSDSAQYNSFNLILCFYYSCLRCKNLDVPYPFHFFK